MLRGSHLNPKLSAWDQVCGMYDYNHTPIGPPGTQVLTSHNNAAQGDDAWYIGSAFDHYRCYTVWSWETRREKETDTALSWFPRNVRMPIPSAIDRIGAGILDIASAIKNPTPGSPLSPLDSSQVAALNDLLVLLTALLPDEAIENNDSSNDSTSTSEAPRLLRVENNTPGMPVTIRHIKMPPNGSRARNHSQHQPMSQQHQSAHRQLLPRRAFQRKRQRPLR